MNKTLITIILLSINGLCFGFSPNTITCSFYYPGDFHKDVDIKNLLLKINSFKAVKVCGEDGSEKAVYTASKISKVRDVYYYHLSRVFKTKGELGVQWSSSPPKGKSNLFVRETYMSTQVKSIDHGDEHFILTHALSAGVLSSFLKAWNKLIVSESKYSEATESLKTYNKQLAASNDLKEYLFESWLASLPKIISVRYVLGGWDLPPHYEFSMVSKRRIWTVGFDFLGDEIKVLRMSLNHT